MSRTPLADLGRPAPPSSSSLPTTARSIGFQNGGVTPFKGQRGEAWEGGYRGPMVFRWPGVIKHNHAINQLAKRARCRAQAPPGVPAIVLV
jgi:hypothetical protein